MFIVACGSEQAWRGGSESAHPKEPISRGGCACPCSAGCCPAPDAWDCVGGHPSRCAEFISALQLFTGFKNSDVEREEDALATRGGYHQRGQFV
jgi:hypothetical protein